MPRRGRQKDDQSAASPRWQKVLWKQQPFPDNHTDATFLRDLVGRALVQA
jgi:hypothetical protein